jgi:hypothetical protein
MLFNSELILFDCNGDIDFLYGMKTGPSIIPKSGRSFTISTLARFQMYCNAVYSHYLYLLPPYMLLLWYKRMKIYGVK